MNKRFATSDGQAPGARKKARVHHTHSQPTRTGSLNEKQKTSPGSRFFVAAGTYERLLYGLECRVVREKKGAFALQLNPIFQFPAHLSCIQTLAFSPPTAGGKVLLVTSGTDEAIKIWDVRKRRETGSLALGTGGVAKRVLYASAQLFVSASSDGTLALLRTRDWTVSRTFKGHHGHINDLAIHPAGRVVLTVASDRTLRMWNLMGSKAEAAAGGKEGSSSTKLGAGAYESQYWTRGSVLRQSVAEGQAVRWNIDGSRFAIIVGDFEVLIYTLTPFRVSHTLACKARCQAIEFVADRPYNRDVLLVAFADGGLRLFDVSSAEPEPRLVAHLDGHSARVKALKILECTAENTSLTLAISASSDGHICFHNLDLLSQRIAFTEALRIPALATYDTRGSRLVCLDAVVLPASQGANDGDVKQNHQLDGANDVDSSDSVEAALVPHVGEDEFFGFDDF